MTSSGLFSQNLDVLKQIQTEPVLTMENYLSKFKKPKKAYSTFVRDFSSVLQKENKICFFYRLQDCSQTEKLFFFSNIKNLQNNVEMTRIQNSDIFYIEADYPEELEFITYSYKKKAGKFMQDPYNPLTYNDPRKSNLVRLSDKVGGFVTVENYFKHKYKRLKPRANTVYLPSEYFKHPDQKFPVIYWLDGQNLWDNPKLPYGGWKVDTTLENLIANGESKAFIIAGLNNTSYRTQEYAGWATGSVQEEIKSGADMTDAPIYAEEHTQMVIQDYIPYIEKNFRVLPGKQNRIIAGSSYGAFQSAYLLQKYPDTFCAAGLFSGGGHGYNQLIAQNSFLDKPLFKIYMDCGLGDSLEKILITETRNMNTYLHSLGYTDQNLLYSEIPAASHNELEWSKRVPDFLKFISK